QNHDTLVQGIGDPSYACQQVEVILAMAGDALAQPVQVVGDFAPDAGCRWRKVATAQCQPAIEAVDPVQGPEHVKAATGNQGRQRVAVEIAGNGQQQRQQGDALQFIAQARSEH